MIKKNPTAVFYYKECSLLLLLFLQENALSYTEMAKQAV